MTETRVSRVSKLLHEAAETHHVVFRITDGADDDWATWYSDWLVNNSEIGEILGAKPIRSELTAALVQLDRDYAERSPGEPWEQYYAAALVERFGSPA